MSLHFQLVKHRALLFIFIRLRLNTSSLTCDTKHNYEWKMYYELLFKIFNAKCTGIEQSIYTVPVSWMTVIFVLFDSVSDFYFTLKWLNY